MALLYKLPLKPVVLNNGDILTIPELFPGWEVPVSELLPVEFE
jgi:Uma2 family endonuclease